MNYQAILFDMDGIIVESESASLAHIQRRVTEAGRTVTAEQLKTLIGLSTEDTVQRLSSMIGSSIDECRVLLDPNLFFNGIIDGSLPAPPVEGFAELSAAFCGRLKYAIASGSPLAVIHAHAQKYGLHPCFSIFVSAEGLPKGKPAPDVYLEAARQLGVSAKECIVLEDAPPGVLAGKAAGAHTIAVPSEHTKHLDFSAADKICASLDEARLYIEKIIS